MPIDKIQHNKKIHNNTNNTISDHHKKLLLSYQISNTENIIRCIKNNGAVLDAGDTGTGKTYSVACAVASMKLQPIIVCPKAVMAIWKNVCKIFDVVPFFIVNYETLKHCKYYDKNGNRKKCPYIEYNQELKSYQWKNLPDKTIFIFDEAHKCSKINTFNGLLLLSAKNSSPNGIIIVSATIADHVETFKIFFYVLNFINKQEAEEQKLTFKEYINIIDKWVHRAPNPILRIHNLLFPNRATRMSIDVLGDLFPENQISVEPFSMGKTAETNIQQEYDIIMKEMEELKGKTAKDRGNILVKVLRAHQKVELLKIPTFVELVNEYLLQNFSVVVFVNFTQTLQTLGKMLSTKCMIYGEQSDEERQFNIEEFQADRQRLIICNIQAGGIGISMHDITGKHRRVSLISPCWSAISLSQALGRIHRAGAKSKALQRIIYCDNTIENSLAEKIRIKLGNLQNLNNGDLTIDLKNIEYIKKPKKLKE